MNDDNINNYVPSILHPRAIRKQHDFSLTQNSIVSRSSLSLKRQNGIPTAKYLNRVTPENKENTPNIPNLTGETQKSTIGLTRKQKAADDDSLGLSAIADLQSIQDSTANSACDLYSTNNLQNEITDNDNLKIFKNDTENNLFENKSEKSHFTVSSATELENLDQIKSVSTIVYNEDNPSVKVSFGVNDCENVNVKANNGAFKQFSISRINKRTINLECEVLETSQVSTETEVDENMNETTKDSLKRPSVTVNLEIKKKKLTQDDCAENTKVLILNTNAIKNISHVIVQPPNYKFVKRNISHKSEYKNNKSSIKNGKVNCDRLKQTAIESYFRRGIDATIDVRRQLECVSYDGTEEMNKNLGATDAAKFDRTKAAKPNKKELDGLPKSARLPCKRDLISPRRLDSKVSDALTPRNRNESLSAHSPRKKAESLHFSLPIQSKSNKTSLSPKDIIPHHKIVAGTHFAVDAFSYGEIPNVKHHFLTHFHSDHYSGLKKSFSKLLFCSKITADLCIARLGVNPKNIHVINYDETLRIDGVEVVALDANHCPGAIMLVFTLPNGKTLLHTGDFRACHTMESFPIFWNKDIHTIYLDTTYCNPRYDFPTQDQSLEMALYILRQKKMALEKVGKQFSSVLIVCGTYTIGKEKFFLGMSRRVGCSVWACPEKERVLQIVEGRPCSRQPPQSCQLHVVPMRDLTHEKLKFYLDSLHGAFSEVVAFKPSGWENGKNSCTEKDSVTIHGIPYSEHSSFSELIRFVKFLNPKQVVPTVDISGGVKSVQKYFPCPLVCKDEIHQQTRVTDYFSIHNRQQVSAVT